MTFAIAERLYPACYSAIASTSELSGERVRGIYINPLLSLIRVFTLLTRARGVDPECKNLQIPTRFVGFLGWDITRIHKPTQGYTPPQGGENKRGGLEWIWKK